MFYVIENRNEHFVFSHAKRRGIGVLVSTVVDDAVHVKIQTIKLGDSILSNQLGYRRVPLAEPPEEFGDTHGGGGCRPRNEMARSVKGDWEDRIRSYDMQEGNINTKETPKKLAMKSMMTW